MSIVWHHISDIFFEDRECCLHILPQLSDEHIMLTHCSKMNVSPAAQVLSSVSKVLLAYGPLNSPEKARFCLLVMDFFFFFFFFLTSWTFKTPNLMNLNKNQCWQHLHLSVILDFHGFIMFSLSLSRIG